MTVHHVRLGSIGVQVYEMRRLCIVPKEAFLQSALLFFELFDLSHVHIINALRVYGATK